MKKGKFVDLEKDRGVYGIKQKWFESLEWKMEWFMSKIKCDLFGGISDRVVGEKLNWCHDDWKNVGRENGVQNEKGGWEL